MLKSLINVSQNLAKSSPYVIYVCGFLVSLISGNPLGIIFSFFSIIFAGALNFILKIFFSKIAPYKLSWMRPNPPIEGCQIFPIMIGPDLSSWGMPSGHSQIISFATSFWILYLWRKSKTKSIWIMINTFIMIGLSALIMYSRIIGGCHNLEQIIIGCIFGVIVGISCYFILEKNKPDLFN